MDTSQQIEQLKSDIISGHNSERQKLVDRLIELEGMDSMNFFQNIFLKYPLHKKEENYELHATAGYGVRQLIDLRARESKSDFRFCPCCASKLLEYEIIDPYMIGLHCENHHCFHIEVEQHGECKDKRLTVGKDSRIDVAKEWLTNANFRKELQNQVAEILRKFIDLNESNYTQEEQDYSYNFCPVCSFALRESKQDDDDWTRGLRCTNNHIFHERNGLSYKLAELKPDITKADFDFLVKAYLDKEQRKYLPDQIVTLLTSIVE